MAAVQPSMYAAFTYLNLLAKLDDDSIVLVSIDRYLNASITDDTQHPRAINADREKDGLLGAIAKELKLKTPYPDPNFEVGGRRFDRLKIQRVFTGKGSPEYIRNVLWLASRYGRTDRTTAQTYCNNYTGLDCNGFTGNYWGIDSTTDIASYNVNPRKNAADVRMGDVLVHFDTVKNVWAHIAAIDSVQATATGDLSLIVVQSAGLEQGLSRDDLGVITPQKTAKNELFFDIWGGNRRVFITAGPAKGTPAS